jgi:phosphomethylpyrimidine synthase
MSTQLQAAKAGKITEQMKCVAQKECLSAELIAKEVAEGRLVIPANEHHIETGLQPAGIGRALTTKVNANIGTSSASSSVENEIEKMKVALEVGADAIMDLSTGGDLDEIRKRLLSLCPVPFGTVPIYQVIEGRGVEDVDEKIILGTIEKQAEQGVDFFTIHAGVLKEYLPFVKERCAGIVSRGGALLAKWMLYHNQQNPLYEMFDDICDIMADFDVTFSLGDGLRPGAIADATDKAQLAELHTLGELTLRAREKGCQVMVEGPGHIPFNQIQYNMEIQQKICHGAPFYVLGPIVTDIAPGYDHITSAIGGTAAAFYGASFLCARGLKGASEIDKEISIARSSLDWEKHLSKSLDPRTAKRIHRRACDRASEKTALSADYCTMCGKDWCSVRINRELREVMQKQQTAETPD